MQWYQLYREMTCNYKWRQHICPRILCMASFAQFYDQFLELLCKMELTLHMSIQKVYSVWRCVCVCLCLQRWRNVSFSSGFIHVQCSVDGIVYVWGRLKRRLSEVLSAPGSRDGKRQEKEEPLICPVTGLGQLICWWWYCWEVKERKYKANPLSFSPQTWNPYF